MPFSLDRSTHFFETLPNGGTQTVLSKDGAPDHVALIRRHLRDEATAFARGDFRSPAAIHGVQMPGLKELSQAGNQLQVAYEAVDRGARIRFTTRSPEIVEAPHAWFGAQVADRGSRRPRLLALKGWCLRAWIRLDLKPE